MRDTCTRNVDCIGDSIQSKIEDLLKNLYPELPLGDLQVVVSRDRSHGTAVSQTTRVQHSIKSFAPEIDTSDLAPTVVISRQENGGGSSSNNQVFQDPKLPNSRGSKFHFGTLQGHYDRSWQVTFTTSLGNVPQLTFTKQCASRDGALKSHLSAIGASIQTATLRQGSLKPDKKGWRTNEVARPGEATTWPIWVMLFNSSEPPPPNISIAKSRDLAIWSAHLDKEAFRGGKSSLAVLRIPGLNASHLRIQRGDRRDVTTLSIVQKQAEAAEEKIAEAQSLGATSSAQILGFAPLAIAEVELFEEVHSPVHEYMGSSPLPPNTASSPFMPAIEPLSESFSGAPTTGRWVLLVRDIAPLPVLKDNTQDCETHRNCSHLWRKRSTTNLRNGVGSISHWELHLTDVLGRTSGFYMDTTFTITTLPKYGHIYNVAEGKRHLFTAQRGQAQWRTNCAGVDTSGLNGVKATDVYRHCNDNYGVATRKGLRSHGDMSERHPIRGSKASVTYVPRVGYTGPDTFQFRVDAGSGLSSTWSDNLGQLAAVSLSVKRCHQRGGSYIPFEQLSALCTCSSKLLSVSHEAARDCLMSIATACTVPTFTQGKNHTHRTNSVVKATTGSGRCDPISGVCAVADVSADKIISDPRPTSPTWQRARASVPTGFQRMCRACKNAGTIDQINRLDARCWSEWARAMTSYGAEVSIGSEGECAKTVNERKSFNRAQCDEFDGSPLQQTWISRADEPGIREI